MIPWSAAQIKCAKMVWGLLIRSIDRWMNGWQASPSVKTTWAKQSARERHGRWLEGAQARATGHGLRQGFLLRDLEGVRILFYSLVAVKWVEEELMKGKRFGCFAIGSNFRRRSSSANGSGGGGAGWVSSSMRWIDVRCLSEMDQRQRLARRRWLGWGKICTGEGAIYRGKWPRM
jgi:hypothetical protein